MSESEEKKEINKALDGEMSEHETKLFRRKLKEDPKMNNEYQQLRTIEEESIKAITPIEVSEDFSTRILGKIKKESKDSKKEE